MTNEDKICPYATHDSRDCDRPTKTITSAPTPNAKIVWCLSAHFHHIVFITLMWLTWWILPRVLWCNEVHCATVCNRGRQILLFQSTANPGSIQVWTKPGSIQVWTKPGSIQVWTWTGCGESETVPPIRNTSVPKVLVSLFLFLIFEWRSAL